MSNILPLVNKNPTAKTQVWIYENKAPFVIPTSIDMKKLVKNETSLKVLEENPMLEIVWGRAQYYEPSKEKAEYTVPVQELEKTME